MKSYRVICFKTGETKPLWAKSFPSAGVLPSPGVFLLAAASAPDKFEPAVRPLTWLDQELLVCAGPVQDILCLKGDIGEPKWRVERIWEYERGFIGPSVWQHTIGRSGRDDAGDKSKDAKKEQNAERPARQNAIVAGPVVVVPKGKRDHASIFVAVAKGPARFAEYLSECVVYEIDLGGEVLAMVNLPRMVRGDRSKVTEAGIVWACQGNAFVRLSPSRDRDRGFGIGPGGSDRLCRVDWYRELAKPEQEAWLRSDPAGSCRSSLKMPLSAETSPRNGNVTSPRKNSRSWLSACLMNRWFGHGKPSPANRWNTRTRTTPFWMSGGQSICCRRTTTSMPIGSAYSASAWAA